MQVEPGNETCILASGGAGSLSIWDIRKLGPKMKPLAEAHHTKTCNSAYFSPTGACLPGGLHLDLTRLLRCVLLQLCHHTGPAACCRGQSLQSQAAYPCSVQHLLLAAAL